MRAPRTLSLAFLWVGTLLFSAPAFSGDASGGAGTVVSPETGGSAVPGRVGAATAASPKVPEGWFDEVAAVERTRARGWFEALVARTDEITKTLRAGTGKSRAGSRGDPVIDTVGSLTGNDTAGVVERLSAAIDTSPDGVKAGVMFTPEALRPHPHVGLLGLSFGLGLLDDGQVHLSGAYEVGGDWNPKAYGEIGLSDCSSWDGPVSTELEKRIEALRAPLEAVCEEVIAFVPEPSGTDTAHHDPWMEAREGCGFVEAGKREALVRACTSGSDDCSLELDAWRDVVRAVVDWATDQASDPGADPDLRRALATHGRRVKAQDASLKAVASYDRPGKLDCHTDEAIGEAYVLARWKRAVVGLGLTGSVDLAPLSSDVLADPDPDLLRGVSGSLGFSLEAGPFMLRIGADYAYVPDGDSSGAPQHLVGPTLSVGGIVASLGKTKLSSGASLRSESGDLEPHVSLGVDVAARVALDGTESLASPLVELEFIPHLDVNASEHLGFQLALPVSASLDGDGGTDPDGSEAVRWSFPLTLSTRASF